MTYGFDINYKIGNFVNKWKIWKINQDVIKFNIPDSLYNSGF